MVTLTHHKKSVRALAIHPTEYSFASGSAGGNNIKKWKCPEGAFVFNFSGHNAIINTLSVNAEGVFFSGGRFLSPSLLYMAFSPYIFFLFKFILLRIPLRGKISQSCAHRYLF
jgi:WD40 repeat protein